MTLPEKTVPQNLLEEDLPGYAYDLLPKNKKEFDLYRSHFGMQSITRILDSICSNTNIFRLSVWICILYDKYYK